MECLSWCWGKLWIGWRGRWWRWRLHVWLQGNWRSSWGCAFVSAKYDESTHCCHNLTCLILAKISCTCQACHSHGCRYYLSQQIWKPSAKPHCLMMLISSMLVYLHLHAMSHQSLLQVKVSLQPRHSICIWWPNATLLPASNLNLIFPSAAGNIVSGFLTALLTHTTPPKKS